MKTGRALLAFVAVFLGRAVESAAQERVVYYIDDPLGSPIALADQTGAVVWRAEYQPFGAPNVEGQTSNAHQFVGKPLDGAAELQDFGARMYDPRLGRFVSPDPGLLGGLPEHLLASPERIGFYTYAANNPGRLVDPDGRMPIDVQQLAGNREFQRAWKLMAHTAEGQRLVSRLSASEAEIVVWDGQFPRNAFASANPGWKGALTLQPGTFVPLYRAEWDAAIVIDTDILRQRYNGKQRTLKLAETLYHELRHAEEYLFPDDYFGAVNKRLDQYARPSADHAEAMFHRQLNRAAKPTAVQR